MLWILSIGGMHTSLEIVNGVGTVVNCINTTLIHTVGEDSVMNSISNTCTLVKTILNSVNTTPTPYIGGVMETVL